MKKSRFVRHLLAGVVTTLVASASAHAQASRTWVSGVGDDVNPCSRTAPCKTFAGAISKTAAGGEIDALDPAGYGVVTITKSITLDGGGGAGFASILASGSPAIIINAATTDVVTLRNLSLNGIGTGTVGIRILAAKTVFVEDTEIFGFRAASGASAGRGISDDRTAGGALFVTNTTVRNNLLSGILVGGAAGTALTATLSNVRLEGNGNAGLAVLQGATVSVVNSVTSGNGGSGLITSDAGSALNVESCISTGNSVGVNSAAGTIVRLSNTTVASNSTGLQAAGGTILSYQNNKITGNTAGNGPPTGTIGVQ
jgi:Right handed beta helix region